MPPWTGSDLGCGCPWYLWWCLGEKGSKGLWWYLWWYCWWFRNPIPNHLHYSPEKLTLTGWENHDNFRYTSSFLCTSSWPEFLVTLTKRVIYRCRWHWCRGTCPEGGSSQGTWGGRWQGSGDPLKENWGDSKCLIPGIYGYKELWLSIYLSI